jgi:hypothetical protein
MQKVDFNARSAADGLIEGCATASASLEDERQAACFQAVRQAFDAGDLARAGELELACRGLSLTKAANLERAAALGLRQLSEGEGGFDPQREIISCMIASPDDGAGGGGARGGAFAQDLKAFCNERFGLKLGMLAPLRAVEIPGSCSAGTEFCAAFTE